MTDEQPPVNRNPVKPGDARRGAKPRSPDGQYRLKRSVYLTDTEFRAYTEWIELLRALRTTPQS